MKSDIASTSGGDQTGTQATISITSNFVKIYDYLTETLVPLIKSAFKMPGSSSSATGSSTAAPKTTKDILTQLANILPTGTYLTFQLLAPLATNNGNCGDTEKWVTAALLIVFATIVVFTCFTDSVKLPDDKTGKVTYGIVTTRGLWNPFGFSGFYTGGTTKYTLGAADFMNAALSLVAFATLTLLTSPITTCFYKGLSATVTKTVPLIVGVVVSSVLTFLPAARNGVGFAVTHPTSSAAQESSAANAPSSPLLYP